MAINKLVDGAQLDAGLTLVADAIRAKAGTSETLSFPSGMVSAVAAITTGGGDNYPTYTGEYLIVPSPDNSIVLNTAEKVLTQDVTIKKIPFYEVSNSTGGTTVSIGKEVI